MPERHRIFLRSDFRIGRRLAEKSGVEIQSLMCYESGKRKLDNAKLEIILKICIALKCKLKDIIEDENIKSILEEIDKSC